MPRGLLLRFLLALIAFAGACAGPAGSDRAMAAEAADSAAATTAERQARAQALGERIGHVQERLAADRQQRDRASDTLARIEQRIGETAGRIAALDRRIRESRTQLERLRKQRGTLEGALAQHRETLAAQLRAAYRLGRRPGLRLLLGQDDPAAAARALSYYAYANEARMAAMERVNGLLDELATVARESHAAGQQLSADRRAMAARRQQLEQARAERERLIARLDKSIASNDARLDKLQRRRRRLERLLDEIDSMLADAPAATRDEPPFGTLAGALPWPVEGSPRARFGSTRIDGRLQWQGMVIAADAGDTVRAVHHGQVVFADWLAGFGYLIVVDHQDGYLTLYGFNQRLLREVGDWVLPGEPIARVGASGGRDQPGLYFEIRSRGKPVDPLDWLAAR